MVSGPGALPLLTLSGRGGRRNPPPPQGFYLHNSKTPGDIEKKLSDYKIYTFDGHFTYFVNNQCSKMLP